MRGLTRRLRSRGDYVVFQVTNEWPIMLSAAGVILGAATILPSAVAIVLSIVAFVIGVLAFARDVRQLRRRWSDYEFSSIVAPFPADAIPPPPSYPRAVYLHMPNRGTVLVSDAIDQTVAGHDLVAELDEEPYRLPRALRGSAPYVLPVCNHGRLVFNGKVVGMRGDPLPPGSLDAPPIMLHIARFFDSQCSNEMCALRITHRDTGEEFDPRRTLLTSANGHLHTLAESSLADVIGVSTLARTSDGALVLVGQSSRNVASPLLLAPSGSGSLDPRDLTRDGTFTLQDIVRHGMERELCEETGIRPDEIRNTAVVGFARWLERGAKPEFFGVTELSVSTEDLARRRHLASDERLYSGGTFTQRVDISALGREISNGTELLTAPSLPVRIREDGSLPLLLALRAAALWQVNAALA
jgi:8-oxo-dGTP pyrophosphatase MutT (NUDIX family)